MLLTLIHWCGAADGQSAAGVLAACAARRWLARNAPGVTRMRSRTERAASACTSMVSCLPTLEQVELSLPGTLGPGDLGCLLEALAWCPRLSGLDLFVAGRRDGQEGEAYCPLPDQSAFAKLRSLTELALSFDEADPHSLDDMVGALVPLTGLAKLTICSPRSAVLPAALGQLKGLQRLVLFELRSCSFEAGCLDLPQLQSLDFIRCMCAHAEVRPNVSALQSLTRIRFMSGLSPPLLESFAASLPTARQRITLRVQQMAYDAAVLRSGGACLPADMGALRSSLLHIDLTGHRITKFPLALTQLVALECLRAGRNDFSELAPAITALSRLTELTLGRVPSFQDPAQLCVCALGDLSGFPTLCELNFGFCEVVLCKSFVGALQHLSLGTLSFLRAHPAPKCTLMVLQLGQALEDLGRGSVLRLMDKAGRSVSGKALQDAQGQAPFKKFRAALEACGL